MDRERAPAVVLTRTSDRSASRFSPYPVTSRTAGRGEVTVVPPESSFESDARMAYCASVIVDLLRSRETAKGTCLPSAFPSVGNLTVCFS
jgi:hypothetical protein